MPQMQGAWRSLWGPPEDGAGEPAASPFVKWAGGKSQLLAQLAPFLPSRSSFRRYFEPFLGGGAVFFRLQPHDAVLSDVNDELVNAYRVVRDSLPELLRNLAQHTRDDRQYYYYMRAQQPKDLTLAGRAARFMFLNKRCYNGLFRVNRKGEFNVPIGRYKTPPKIFDERNLTAVSRLLQGAQIRCDSYEEVLREAQAGDFVYLDPPYQPLSATANFTSYTKERFSFPDQQRLASLTSDLDARGVMFLLSNSAAPELIHLYKGFHVTTAKASRQINSRADRRGHIDELIVANRLPPCRPLGREWSSGVQL